MNKTVAWYGKTYDQLDSETRQELKEHMAKMDGTKRENYILYMTNGMGYTKEQLGVI